MYATELFGRLEVRTAVWVYRDVTSAASSPGTFLRFWALRGPLAKLELTELLWDGRCWPRRTSRPLPM
jgi:hypothetical protein